ncbi:MAG: hypothetical protein LBD04_02375 [Synergistaceae bacterium]|jgi:hypothetical protein|nr:hypothetical protein [Synergistaceae bacterium]
MENERIIKALELKSLEKGDTIYYVTKEIMGKELYGCIECNETEIENLIGHIKNVLNSLENLDDKAKELIQENYPDEDAGELIIDAVNFYNDFTFSLGYPTEETVAGNEYIYVKFNKDFEREKELIYDYY